MDIITAIERLKPHAEPMTTNPYFKTGEGDYQHGDLFLGLPAKAIHEIAGNHVALATDAELDTLLASAIHDHRAIALEILARRSAKGTPELRQRNLAWYLARLDRVNGWDLVDMSAPAVVGLPVLASEEFVLLHTLVADSRLWAKRVGVVATLTLIRAGRLDETLAVLRAALPDDRDLIHKAVGWMLREVGKRDRPKLDAFLRTHYDILPRTTLRYAIERHAETVRRDMLKGIFKEE